MLLFLQNRDLASNSEQLHKYCVVVVTMLVTTVTQVLCSCCHNTCDNNYMVKILHFSINSSFIFRITKNKYKIKFVMFKKNNMFCDL